MGRQAPTPGPAWHEQRAENRRASNAAQPVNRAVDESDATYRDYEVIGRHAISGVKKGGIVSLPDSPQTKCLLESGHVKPKASAVEPIKKPAFKKGSDNG